jgi:hypothetical protein
MKERKDPFDIHNCYNTESKQQQQQVIQVWSSFDVETRDEW